MSASSPLPVVLPPASHSVIAPAASATLWVRARDYLELAKPKIAVLALLTVWLGFALAAAGSEWSPLLVQKLWATVLGVGLVAASSSAWNHLIEHRIDARMVRTCRRPLPAGRLSLYEVAGYACVTGVLGLIVLGTQVNFLTTLLAFATLVLYAAVYTPLKRYSCVNTVVGAIPGALPPVLGWTAAGGSLDSGAFALFAILFLWQFPHFMAIAWLYREDYREARLRMLPCIDATGYITGAVAVGYCLVLWPVSCLPAVQGLSGPGYLLAAIGLGGMYLFGAIDFLWRRTVHSARRLLWSSLLYLPALLLALVGDRYRLLS